MKPAVFLSIAIRIIILCMIPMMWTFIDENLHEFFEDTQYEGWHGEVKYHWGVRHWWYFAMQLGLFALSVINIIMYIIKLTEEE